MIFLGIDTSNYTTSVATYDGEKIFQQKKILEVLSGEKGLRQSDAVFKHIVNLPELIANLLEENSKKLTGIGVSNKPRNVDGSYMPCFLVGETVATAASETSKIPLFKNSHQVGHILAALYSANRLDLIDKKIIAFHVSGGTTEALLVTPDKELVLHAEIIAESTDLKAGQAIDRVGVMLGLNFPSGAELDRLSLLSKKTFSIKPSMIGNNCSLSGIENKCKKMFSENELPEDIALFCITYILKTIDKMAELLLEKHGDLPLVFAGGVMSNSIIRKNISKKYGAVFASPEFSSDNAAGTAIQAYLRGHI